MAHEQILVVDDEPSVRDGWARALKLSDFVVHKAGTAAEALELCDEHSFDLVVLDYLMPSMDGVELLMRIRKKQPTIRSIVVSGKLDTGADEATVRSLLHESVEPDRYLHKPVANQQLISAIRDLLDPEAPRTWKDIAKQAVRAQKARVIDARAASRRLRTIKAGRKK